MERIAERGAFLGPRTSTKKNGLGAEWWGSLAGGGGGDVGLGWVWSWLVILAGVENGNVELLQCPGMYGAVRDN